MAWEQIVYPITSYVEQGTIVNFSCCENVYVNRQGDAANIAFIANYMTGGFTDSINFPVSETEIFRQGAFSITLKQSTTIGMGRGFELRCKQDGESLKLVFSNGGNDSYKSFYKFGFAIDRVNQRGAFVIGTYEQGNYYSNVGRVRSNIDSNNTEINLYNWLIQAIPILYTWQSVPSISGKNGISSFTCLKDALLTGSDVGSLTTSDFDSFSDTTKLQNLVLNIPADSSVVPVGYAGQVDYIGISRNSSTNYTIGLYIGGASGAAYSRSWTQSGSYNAWLAFCIDDENEVAQMAIVREVSGGTISYIVDSPSDADMHTIWLFLHSHQGTDEETDEDNTPEADGESDGEWIDATIAGLEVPTLGAIDTGFTSMYEIPLGELQKLSKFLWSDNFVDNVKKFFNDPREIIVGLSIMPISPNTDSGKAIKAGGIDTGATGRPLTSQYLMTDVLGSITIEKKKKRRFLNYAPYTKITAFLPYVGTHSLDVSDVMGKTLTLKYMFDFLTGSCVAQIAVNGKPKYFFGGSCGIQIPTSSEDFSRIYNGIISAGATIGSVLSTIATGGLTAPMMIGAAGNMLSNSMSITPNVEYSSGNGSINGMLTSQTAFLMIETPDEKIAKNQDKYTGRSSYITAKLSDCTGYTKCFSVHLDNFAATEAEREEIESALYNGVRIESGSATPSYTPSSITDKGLIFLKCTSDKDVIGKTWSQETADIKTVEGKILFNKNILNPTFLIETDVSAFNYCYIPLFNRFYYITNVTVKSGTMKEIEMKVDVLQSWKGDSTSGILSNSVILERSENQYNTYFNDPEVWTQQNKKVSLVPFLTDVGTQVNFARSNNKYIITIAGSDTTPT